MRKQLSSLNRFLRWSDKTAGKPIAFIIALTFLFIWIVVGFISGFTNVWLLIITAIATINASLMVFIIQNTQNRQSKALNLKLDGILAQIKETESELIAIEGLDEEELDKIRSSIIQKNKHKKIKNQKSLLARFLTWSSKTAGHPLTFVIAIAILILWIVFGFIWGFTAAWLLILDTIATINASLMVFIIQNTQNREIKALHVKVDGIIDAIKEEESELIALEESEEEEIEKIRKYLIEKRKLK